MALPTFTANCPDCGAAINLTFEYASIRRMGDLVRLPILVTDEAWASTMVPHIESIPDHATLANLG